VTANVCPACGKAIATADVNVGEGVALCRGCGKLSRLSEVVDAPASRAALVEEPPLGCHVVDDGVEWRAEATTRSVGGAIAALFFAAFWNSIVGVFVAVALGSLWLRLVGPLPSWAPQTQAGVPLAVACFLVLFLVPFVAVGLAMIGMVFMGLGGRVEVRMREGTGVIFTGVGPVGWRRRFDALAVTSVRIGEVIGSEGGRSKHIEMRLGAHGRRLKFGTGLSEQRREWLTGVCQAVLEPGRRR
jgi:hypothetical protein